MAYPVKDMVGQRVGRLVVIARGVSATRNAAWRCRCDCGNEITVRRDHLRQGFVKSCGCLKREIGPMNATAAAVKLGELMKARHAAGVYDHLKGKRPPKDWSAINQASARRAKSHKAKDAQPAERPKQFSASALDDLARAWP